MEEKELVALYLNLKDQVGTLTTQIEGIKTIKSVPLEVIEQIRTILKESVQ